MRVGPHNGGRGPFLTSYSSSSLKRWVGGGPSSSSCLHLIRRISSTSFFPLLVSLSSPPHTFSFYSFSPFTYSLPWYAKSTFSFLFSPHSRCLPPPCSFLFHNGGRCHRPLPNVQRITHGVISMHYFILSAVGRSKKAANTQLNEHRIYHQWLYVLVVFFNSLTWVDRTFIIFGSTRLYFLVCLSISVPVHFFTKHDEISRSRKISWDLATRILARPRDILFYFSSPSQNLRFDRTNSRSRLEAQDWENTKGDLVSNNEIINIARGTTDPWVDTITRGTL